MNAQPVRLTMVVADVLDVILSAPDGDPVWGLQICQQTGRGSGTVFPALGRLKQAGWIADSWEDPVPVDRPRRRYYTMTPEGRERYAATLADRASRKTSWVRPRPVDGASDD